MCLWLNVYWSNVYIYVQIINDDIGQMLVFVFMCSLEIVVVVEGLKKCEVVKKVGQLVVQWVIVVGVMVVVFDCNGFKYYGWVVVLVEGVCEGGLVF